MLKLENVGKSFGGLTAVIAMDLAVQEGEIVGLIGPNGAGKTTLFNLITGFYKADTGRVTFQGQDITRLGPPDRCKRGIARTFQHVRPFQHLTLLENVEVGRIYGRDPSPTRRRAQTEAEELLQRVGLTQDSAAHASSLTLMNRKRLELARALATRPQLLLLDEWLAGLNPSEVLEAIELLRALRVSGITILLVEHLVKALLSISDRVVAMDAGEKIAEGTPVEVVTNPKVIEAYLGPEMRHAGHV